MNLLPNVENAYIDIRKLSEYVLNPTAPRGRHKARVFLSALGIDRDRADNLAKLISQAVLASVAQLGELDIYGQRYVVDCRIVTDDGDAIVRTAWIIRTGEDSPRLTTCYVV